MHELSRGFTLIELIVTISILAIVATIAVPSFNSIIQNNQLNTEMRNLSTILSRARSDAVLRKRNMTVKLNSSDLDSETQLNWLPKEGLSYKGATQEVIFTAEGTVTGFTSNLDFPVCHPKLKLQKTISITRMGTQLNQANGACDD